ncbi:hypothetical protein B0T39_04565 [Chromobacterium haemolyticum]|nr:hypothetical protein B0T39_04565 [Chromobacterium haemolyticum]
MAYQLLGQVQGFFYRIGTPGLALGYHLAQLQIGLVMTVSRSHAVITFQYWVDTDIVLQQIILLYIARIEVELLCIGV